MPLSLIFASKPVILGFAIIVLVVIVAIFAPWIAPYSPTKNDLLHTLAQPSAVHWLGTDALPDDTKQQERAFLIWIFH